MLVKCPGHQIGEQDLFHYFMKGLMPDERRLVNAACGGSVLNMQPIEVFKLIGDMAEETRDVPPAMGKEIPAVPALSSSRSEIGILCSLFKQVVEIVKQTFKRGVDACQSCYGASRPKGKYHNLAEDDEGGARGSSSQRGRRRRANQHDTPWMNDEAPESSQNRYQSDPGNHLPQAGEPTLTDAIHNLALAQRKTMEDLTMLRAETQEAFVQMANSIAQIAGVIAKLPVKHAASTTQARVQPGAQVNTLQLKGGSPCRGKSRRKSRKKETVRESAKEVELPCEATLPKEIEETEEWAEPRFSSWISSEEENKFM